jgi:hypothetical protein
MSISAVREIDAGEIARCDGPADYLRALLTDGPTTYIENASITLRALEVDGRVVPLAIVEPGRALTYVCSPHSHYVGYTLFERTRRASALARCGYRAFFGVYGALLRACRIDRVVYIDNWLLATNPLTPLTAEQISRVTAFVRERYPRHAIVQRNVVPALDAQRFADLGAAGYRMVKSRRVYLFDPRETTSWWHNDVRKDRRLLRRTLYHVTQAAATDRLDIGRLARFYRDVYLDRHCVLNPHYTERFFALLLRERFFTTWVWQRDGRCDAFGAIFASGTHYTGMMVGYDLSRPQHEGLYRQVMMNNMIEARRAGRLINLSGGAREFKQLRGAVEHIEYDAVYDRHLPGWRRLGWRLVELQGRLWRFS